MATETITTPALEATPAADPAPDLSELTTTTAEELASLDQHDQHDDSNDTSSDQELGKKRSSEAADLKDGAPPAKVTKRRAARACVSCRARKVRCDVVEGAPCGNCRWDNVECIVQESRRRKKTLLTASTAGHLGAEAQLRSKGANPVNIHSSAELRRPSNASVASVNGSVAANPVSAPALPLGATPTIGTGAAAMTGVGPGLLGGLSAPSGPSNGLEGHVPHMICRFFL
ncbi:fungal specific transcription factor domain-containing protein [Colletotrichum graminicola]|nr:fungal specific transcription factor domain-containing protein [Colletotrichum graminicola]